MTKQVKQAGLFPHLMILGACIIWGVMAPLGKDAMMQGIDPYSMFFMRVSGASVCLWITDWLLHRNMKKRGTDCTHISRKDICLLALAAIFGSVCNQGFFTVGLSLTWPINASILTTTLPIFTLLVGLLFHQGNVSLCKATGILAGLAGALLLILGSRTNANVHLFADTMPGDLLIIMAQCAVAFYLNSFRRLIERNNALTIQKWMMSLASLYVLPLAWTQLTKIEWTQLSVQVYVEVIFVVLCSTFMANVMMTRAQQYLSPTAVAMYNYVQPAVACVVSFLMGIGVLGPLQLGAMLLVFLGVRLVTRG